MARGKVKFFNTKKGYGFIKPDNGDSDIFVHISALEASGLRSLDEGDDVVYEESMNKGKKIAVNVNRG